MSQFDNNLQAALLCSIKENADRPAFFFEDTYYSYYQLAGKVASLQNLFLRDNTVINLGIIANNDFDTYAAIVACLLSGITYVPIEPTHPDERNSYVISLSQLSVIYCSDTSTLKKIFYKNHISKFLFDTDQQVDAKEPRIVKNDRPAYILFTSGTTGIPKGVPITKENLEAFVDNINKMGLYITNTDRFLQVFDLTFDASVFSYLVPLLRGACIYPAPKIGIKNTFAVNLIEDKSITHIFTVPSFINYLKPYFGQITLPTVKFWLFCGEALKTENVVVWQDCVPNGEIFNSYGPTEATVFCTSFFCKPNAIKERNGVVCIGKPFANMSFHLFDENNSICDSGNIGELCIAGPQLTSGYLNGDKINSQKFFNYNGLTYYRTGDLCSVDSEGNYFFEGRGDSQIKVNGYRVELGEIENAALGISEIKEAVAMPFNELNSQQIILFIVSEIQFNETTVINHLKKTIPHYMLPKKIIFVKDLPYNLNGKIDKQSLLSTYEQSLNTES